MTPARPASVPREPLQQSTFAATQRVAGTILGATIATVFLLGVENKHVLESGGHDTGWLSPKDEDGVAAFQRWVREAVDS